MIHICVDKIIKDRGDPYVLRSQPWNINSHSGIHRKYWNAGQTLRIRFLGGDPLVQEKLKKKAVVWSTYANLSFDFIVEGDSDIRIDFQRNGSWSYIGTDAKYIPQNQPTMNYGRLQLDTQDREYYIVLHEFGHALGLIHEHPHPENGVPWDNEAVYNYFSSAPHFWNREIVDAEIFRRYNCCTYGNSGEFDPRSIMRYFIPEEFMLPGFQTGWNTDLSEGDKKTIKSIYPYAIKENNVSKDDKQVTIESNNPLEVLKLRFAKGEISKSEFLEMRRILES